MKIKHIIAGILVANVVALWCLAHHYEFHTGVDGRAIWRCNNFTGKVEYSLLGKDQWVAISYQQPIQDTPDFDSETNK
ncbi:MAG: hypothetical protein WBS33_01620 [Verrucomicrobiia bacterium]